MCREPRPQACLAPAAVKTYANPESICPECRALMGSGPDESRKSDPATRPE